MKLNTLNIAVLAKNVLARAVQQVQDGEDMEGSSPRQPGNVVETPSSVVAGVEISENRKRSSAAFLTGIRAVKSYFLR